MAIVIQILARQIVRGVAAHAAAVVDAVAVIEGRSKASDHVFTSQEALTWVFRGVMCRKKYHSRMQFLSYINHLKKETQDEKNEKA